MSNNEAMINVPMVNIMSPYFFQLNCILRIANAPAAPIGKYKFISLHYI